MSVVSCSKLVIFGGVCWSGEEFKQKHSFSSKRRGFSGLETLRKDSGCEANAVMDQPDCEVLAMHVKSQSL